MGLILLQDEFDKVNQNDSFKYSILRNIDRYRILSRLIDKTINFINLKRFTLFIDDHIKRDLSIYQPYKA